MTISIVLVGLALAATEARAEPPSSQVSEIIEAPRASVVRVMQDAGQALLWDGIRGEYVVVRVGDLFHHYRVSAIRPEHVVLTARQGNQHFVLPRTPETPDVRTRRASVAASTAASASAQRSSWQPSGTSTELLDPYPSATHSSLPPASVTTTVSASSMLDPYGTRGPINSVTAPPELRASTQTHSSFPATPARPAPSPPAPSQPAPRPPAAAAASPASATASPASAAPVEPAVTPATPVAGKVLRERYTVSRREFDAAVTDFHTLSKEIRIELVGEGVHISDVARGSLFYRWGLRPGDVVLSVDKQPIRSVDDAAAVYAQLMDARKFVVKARRGANTMILTYRFKK